MTLDELLGGDEGDVSEWLRKQNLLHECYCGYTVYDPDDIGSAVQHEWGDERSDEIYQWSCDLANRFGWLFIESAQPKFGIYHCQHCHESEWAFLMDAETIASTKTDETSNSEATATPAAPKQSKATERLVVYVDESYSDEFPRKEGGSFAYAALIIPEAQAGIIETSVGKILVDSYRGKPAKELKYNKIAKRDGLLERIGSRVAKLLHEIPGAWVIGVYVPRAGYFGEKVRSIKAVAHYRRRRPDETELESAQSVKSVEDAVRQAPNTLAHVIACCVASFVGSNASFAKIVFDPRSKQLDEALVKGLQTFLPGTPVNVPLFRHGSAVVTPWPTADLERLGNRVSYEFDRSSHESRGLQLADFVAGDIRTFFNETPELLDAATTAAPLVNHRVLFPEAFRTGRISGEILAKLDKRTGRSFLPQYRDRLVNRLISYYTRNGQMRNLDTETGQVFDLMD